MDGLILDDEKKRIIQAICQEHTTLNDPQPTDLADLIPGEGKRKTHLPTV